jgi:hypothetical protein
MACGDAGAGNDGGEPADTSDAVDAVSDAVADAGRVGWVEDRLGPYTIWRHEASDTPCAPWAPIDAPPRGLPPDPTPRILWTWTAVDEPSLGILAYTALGYVAARPTGGAVVQAAGNEYLVHLDREGGLEGAPGPTIVVSHAVLPNDSTAAFIAQESAAPPVRLRVSNLDETGFLLPMSGGGGIQPLTTTADGELVYHRSPGLLHVVCADDGRLRHEIEITSETGEYRVGWLQTSATGQLIVNPYGASVEAPNDPLILEASGEPVVMIDAWRAEAWEGIEVFEGQSEGRLAAVGWQRGEGRFGELYENTFVWTGTRMEHVRVEIVPDGRLWLTGPISAGLYREGVEELSIDHLRRYDIIGEDGSMIGTLDDAPEVLVRILPDGTEAWRLTLPSAGPIGYDSLALNEQGVLFATLGNTLAAIQIDVLPPAGCHRERCNFQRNGWAGPASE